MQVKYLNRALMRFESKVCGASPALVLIHVLGEEHRAGLTVQEVIPTQFVFFSLAGESHRVSCSLKLRLTRPAIIGSAVLYQEFRDVTFSQFVNFAFGVSHSHNHS